MSLFGNQIEERNKAPLGGENPGGALPTEMESSPSPWTAIVSARPRHCLPGS
jgi:hypothetical protein